MSSRLILVDRAVSGITVITLNRAEKRNALSVEMLQALCETLDETCKMEEQRIVILKGAGDLFSSGLDLSEAELSDKAILSGELIARLYSMLRQSPLISIAAVHGAAYAGGAGLAAACDLALASPETLFGFPETRRGMVAAQVAALLRGRLGDNIIKELLLTGEMVNAERALSLSLINRIIPRESLFESALEIAQAILLGAPDASKITKKMINTLSLPHFEQDLRYALEIHHQVRKGEEAKVGVRAFLEKRSPRW